MFFENAFFWTCLGLLIQLLMVGVWGLGILYTLSKISKYHNMFLGMVGCLGMMVCTLGDIVCQIPSTFYFMWDAFDQIIASQASVQEVWNYLHGYYRWEGIQMLFQICLVAAIAGRLKVIEPKVGVAPKATVHVTTPKHDTERYSTEQSKQLRIAELPSDIALPPALEQQEGEAKVITDSVKSTATPEAATSASAALADEETGEDNLQESAADTPVDSGDTSSAANLEAAGDTAPAEEEAAGDTAPAEEEDVEIKAAETQYDYNVSKAMLKESLRQIQPKEYEEESEGSQGQTQLEVPAEPGISKGAVGEFTVAMLEKEAAAKAKQPSAEEAKEAATKGKVVPWIFPTGNIPLPVKGAKGKASEEVEEEEAPVAPAPAKSVKGTAKPGEEDDEYMEITGEEGVKKTGKLRVKKIDRPLIQDNELNEASQEPGEDSSPGGRALLKRLIPEDDSKKAKPLSKKQLSQEDDQ